MYSHALRILKLKWRDINHWQQLVLSMAPWYTSVNRYSSGPICHRMCSTISSFSQLLCPTTPTGIKLRQKHQRNQGTLRKLPAYRNL